MKITIHYGLPFRENVGVKEEIVEMEQNSNTVAGVLQLIAQRHPSLKSYVDASSDEAQRRHLVVSLNSRLARLSESVHDGDKMSLLLPVIGGA